MPLISLCSKRFRASLSIKLGREQKKEGITGEGEGREQNQVVEIYNFALNLFRKLLKNKVCQILRKRTVSFR